MARPELRMSFADAEALVREFDTNLKHGRGFLSDAGPEAGIAVLSDCTLVLVHPDSGRELSLAAQAVMVSDTGPVRGIGLELRPFDREVREALERFVRGEGGAEGEAHAGDASGAAEPTGVEAEADAEADAGEDAETAGEKDGGFDADEGATVDGDAEGAADDAGVEEEGAGQAEGEGEPAPPGTEGMEQRTDVQTLARIDALRRMSHVQRQKIARAGELPDRVLLERLFGRDVWSQLLLNPKLTLPEVARIARKRTVPRPLLALIVDNNAWIQATVVRRALLSNSRIGNEAVDKLIRLTPKHELKLMSKTYSYPGYVREAVRKALKKEES